MSAPPGLAMSHSMPFVKPRRPSAHALEIPLVGVTRAAVVAACAGFSDSVIANDE